jgi:uncharacterized membrane protein
MINYAPTFDPLEGPALVTAHDATVGPAEVLAARFQTRAEADPVREKIQGLGYDPMEVSYIADASKCSFTFDEPGSHWNKMGIRGVVSGAATGGIVATAMTGLGLGSLVFLGPVGAAAAAAIGGVVGLLLGAGLDSDAALACESAVNDGAVVMIVQTHSGDEDRVRAILGEHIIGVEKDEYISEASDRS